MERSRTFWRAVTAATSWLVLGLLIALCIAVFGCQATGSATSGTTSMKKSVTQPTTVTERWSIDGSIPPEAWAAYLRKMRADQEAEAKGACK